MSKTNFIKHLEETYVDKLRQQRHWLTPGYIKFCAVGSVLSPIFVWGMWYPFFAIILFGNIFNLLMTLNVNKVVKKPIPHIMRYQMVAVLGVLFALVGLTIA